jgi:hypothetical protein
MFMSYAIKPHWRRTVNCLACSAAAAGVLFAVALPCAAAKTDWNKVAGALGKAGAEMPSGVYRVGLPRTDLHVTLDCVDLKPDFALGSWLAFRSDGSATMVMGDLVLTETEIAPVTTKLAEGGIEITALHNHLLRAQPATFYMHVFRHGDAVTLATALHDGLALSKTLPGDAGSGAAAPQTPSIDLDTAMIDRTLGAYGRVAGGVYQFGIARAETIKDGGMEVPVAMGRRKRSTFSLPAMEDRHNWRLRAHGGRGQPGFARAAPEWHRGDRAP